MSRDQIGSWVGSHNTYHATAGAIRLNVYWEKGGYMVRVNDTVLSGPPEKTLQAAIQRALINARRLAEKTLAEVERLERESLTWDKE